MEDLGITDLDYLVNEAGGGHARNPSLELLPNPKPLFFESKERDGERALRYIQFPNPLDGNMHKHLMSSPREVRDVTFTNGFIRLIEIEELTILPVAPDNMPSNDPRNRVAAAASLELENTMATCTTESYAPDAAGLRSHGLERLPRMIVGAGAARPMLMEALSRRR